MKSDFTIKQQQAIESGKYSFHFFFDLTYPLIGQYEVTERIWTGVGDIEYYPPDSSRPLEYLGMGEILEIDIIPESSELRVQYTTITLSYLSDNIFNLVTFQDLNLKGNQGTLWIGILDERDRIIDNLILQNTMIIDTADFETYGEGIAIVITGISGLANLNFPTRFKWSSEDQNEYLRYLQEKGISENVLYQDIGFDTLKTLSAKDETAEWNFGIEDSDQSIDIQPTVMNGGKSNFHAID